ncbi:hypothetical protein DFH09DRAFT_1314821 [Mycena vulgaris]|nr:hypothetical protein DFH09DRAFT_1314821 [Mycena vulgaris]
MLGFVIRGRTSDSENTAGGRSSFSPQVAKSCDNVPSIRSVAHCVCPTLGVSRVDNSAGSPPISMSRPTRSPAFFPTHAVVLAAHSAKLPRLPLSAPAGSSRTASTTLPILPLTLPFPHAFAILHAFMYTYRLAPALAALLPLPPAFLASGRNNNEELAHATLLRRAAPHAGYDNVLYFDVVYGLPYHVLDVRYLGSVLRMSEAEKLRDVQRHESEGTDARAHVLKKPAKLWTALGFDVMFSITAIAWVLYLVYFQGS